MYFDFQRLATAEPWHVERFVQSWEWIKNLQHSSVLECGGPGPFNTFLKEQGWSVDGTNCELSLPFTQLATRDLILCMEVLEHIKDPDTSDTFTFRGMKNLVESIYNSLQPGGYLFLTTPNVCCVPSIYRMLRGFHPFQYQPHERELSPGDVATLLYNTGFKIKRTECVNVWKHYVPDDVRADLESIVTRLLGDIPPHFKGDCTFVLATK